MKTFETRNERNAFAHEKKISPYLLLPLRSLGDACADYRIAAPKRQPLVARSVPVLTVLF